MGEMTLTTRTRNQIGALSTWFEQNADTIVREAPKGYDIAKARGMALQLIRESERADNHLNECTPVSLIGAVLKAARHDLSIDNGDAYVIARRNKHLNGAYEAHLEISYRGLVKMARRAGSDWVKADLVRDGDVFNADNPDPDHVRGGIEHVKADPFSDAPVLGVYAIIRTKTGAMDFEVMSRAEVERARAQGGGKSQAWARWWGEMAKKVVLRRLLKRHDLADEDRSALSAGDAIEATLLPQTTTADLNARFAGIGTKALQVLPSSIDASLDALKDVLAPCYESREEVLAALGVLRDNVPPDQLETVVAELSALSADSEKEGEVSPRREVLASYGV